MERNRIAHTFRGRFTTSGTLVRTRAENIRDIRLGRERLELYQRNKAFRDHMGYDHWYKRHNQPRDTSRPVSGAPYHTVPAGAHGPHFAQHQARFYEIDMLAKWLRPAPSGCQFPSWKRILQTPEPGEVRQFWSPRRKGSRGGYRVYEGLRIVLQCPQCSVCEKHGNASCAPPAQRIIVEVTASEGVRWLVRQAQLKKFPASYRSVEHMESAPLGAWVQRMPREIYASDFVRERHSKFAAAEHDGGHEERESFELIFEGD